MKYISKKLFLIPALTLLVSALLYPRLPAEIPVHFNAAGVPDNYHGRWFIFVIPLLSVALLFLAELLPRIDPRHANYSRFSKAYQALHLGVTVLLNVCCLVMAGYALGLDLNIGFIVSGMVGLMFMVLGNYMPKFKQNFFCGIRTPWAISDPDNWAATHRFSGPLWMLGGLGFMLLPFLGERWIVPCTLGLALLLAVLPYVYSYLYFRKHAKKD